MPSGGRVPLVERHDARLVHHLGEDDHVVGRLEELQVLVVAAPGGDGHDRRAGVEAEEATLGEPAVLGAVEADAAHHEPHGAVARRRVVAVGDGELPRGRRPRRRNPAVRGIDDERRAPVVDHADHAVVPEIVVADDAAAGRQRLRPDGGRPVRLDGLLQRGRLDGRRFLRRQLRLAGPSLGPLERRQGAEVPDGLEIRPAVGESRRLEPGLRRGRRRHARCGDEENQNDGAPRLAHRMLLDA